jgi:hypothetical protein
MIDNTQMVRVPRELLERLCMRPHKESLAVNHQDIMDRGRAQAEMRELLTAPPEDIRAVVDEPVQIIAVAVTREDDEEGLRLEWLLEGGISELEFAGTVLFAMPEANDLCDEDGSAELYRRPQCSEVSPQCSEHLRTQGTLLPHHTLLPHPPRHWGFLQPEREVPGYTLEQMMEYGAQCAAEALRQNK